MNEASGPKAMPQDMAAMYWRMRPRSLFRRLALFAVLLYASACAFIWIALQMAIREPAQAVVDNRLLALAADRSQMNASAILGPVDPQLAGFPAHSIATLLEKKPIERMSEEWYVLALESRKAIDETTRLVRELVASPTAVSRLTNGDTTHGLGIGLREAQEIGLPVYEGISSEIMALADHAIAASKAQEFPFPGR